MLFPSTDRCLSTRARRLRAPQCRWHNSSCFLSAFEYCTLASSLVVFSEFLLAAFSAGCGTDIAFLPMPVRSFLTNASRREISLLQVVKHMNDRSCGNQFRSRSAWLGRPLFYNGPIWNAIWNACSFTVLLYTTKIVHNEDNLRF